MWSTDICVSCLLVLAHLLLGNYSVRGAKQRTNAKPVPTTMTSMPTNNNCSISSFDSCLSTIREVQQNPRLAFPVTKDDLSLACRKLKEGDTCAHNHMKNCTNKSQKMLFNDIVKGTKKVLDWLCVPGQFQNNYLRFAKCFKNVSLSEHKCSTVIKRVQTMSFDPNNTPNIEQQLKKFCCSMKESVDCQIDFVRRDCGEKAVEFFDKYLDEISSPLMVEHCATYTYSDRCNPAVDTHTNADMTATHPRIDGIALITVCTGLSILVLI